MHSVSQSDPGGRADDGSTSDSTDDGTSSKDVGGIDSSATADGGESAGPDRSSLHHNEEQPIPSSPASPSTAESLHDIGTIAKPSATIDDICLRMCNLSNGERFDILFRHIEPPTSLPTTFAHGCNRKFSIS